ncbi:hypothetical protein J2D73_11610 [Acetobacter sacchari]|uniref:Type III secretion protein n=1 Tax=Acetobacter sacchari TaxID=2661687 RepID=A0ABS3LWZ8_9PROT|nr:hypothetical protein [Acetobacter sacchari]MBO1360434.1 hypothetical protein [Acetobacter sacchari]
MDSAQRDLLLSIAYLYTCRDRAWRALPLLLLVTAESPDDCVCLRLLAHVYTTIGRAELALIVLDRIDRMPDMKQPGDLLMRARAVHGLGRIHEARKCFLAYIQSAGVQPS